MLEFKADNQQTGFTIVELLIVIVIIGVLAAISIVAYTGISKRATEASIVSDLRQASTVLEMDKASAGAYPSSLALAQEGKGLNAGDGLIYEYSYDSATNSYCLTANSSKVTGMSAFYISNTNPAPTAGACPGHSSTSMVNLVANGLGEMGNNANFPGLDFVAGDAPPGSKGSFVTPDGVYKTYTSNEPIPVDPSKKYIVRGWAKQNTAGVGNSRIYFGLTPLDVDKKPLISYMYMYRPGTTTALAQPLKAGDTVVYLNSISANWYDEADTRTYHRSLIFWDYKDSTGKVWPPETYSFNGWRGDLYDGGTGAINRIDNTITLKNPWTGSSYSVGHPVSNGSSGGSWMYSAADYQLLTGQWREFVSPAITGTHTGGLSAAKFAFPVATKYVRILVIAHAGSPSNTSRQSFGGIRFYEAP